MTEIPEILSSYEEFCKHIMGFGFEKPTVEQFEQAVKVWNERNGDKK